MQLSVLSRRLLRSSSYRSYQSVLSNRAQVSSVRCFSLSPKLSEAVSSFNPHELVVPVALSAIVGAGAMYLDSKECSTPPRDKYIHEIIDELRSRVLSPPQAPELRDKDGKPVLFDLNPDVADLIKKHSFLLIEGGPGEGKSTQVMRSILESRPKHDENELPLILHASLRRLKYDRNPYSLFFTGPKSVAALKDKTPEDLFKRVVKAAVARGIPVYVVVGDAEQLVDVASNQKHAVLKRFFNLAFDCQERRNLRFVYTTSRLFSDDLSAISGQDDYFESYQWKHDPNSLSSALKKCDNIQGKRAEDLTKVFGHRIQDYITFHYKMSGRVDDESYEEVMKERKSHKLRQLNLALLDLGKPSVGLGMELLNKLSKEGEVKFHWKLNQDVLKGLQRHKIIDYNYNTVTWTSPLTKVVYDEEQQSNEAGASWGFSDLLRKAIY